MDTKEILVVLLLILNIASAVFVVSLNNDAVYYCGSYCNATGGEICEYSPGNCKCCLKRISDFEDLDSFINLSYVKYWHEAESTNETQD